MENRDVLVGKFSSAFEQQKRMTLQIAQEQLAGQLKLLRLPSEEGQKGFVIKKVKVLSSSMSFYLVLI